MFGLSKKVTMPTAEQALPGRSAPILTQGIHAVLGSSYFPPFPTPCDTAVFGMGCFWGAERLFWQCEGVTSTAVGYSAGFTPNPTYEEVCSGLTGHNEVVLVVYDRTAVSYEQLLMLFWENHNPTQGMQQANDRGTQYRSGIYTANDEQAKQAQLTKTLYQEKCKKQGLDVTTEIAPQGPFYYAEAYHQQYLSKNPQGYCNLQSIEKTGLPKLG